MGLRDYVSNMTLKVNYDGSLAEQGLSKLAGLAGGLITIYAMKQLLDYSVGLAKIGAQANTTERNFSKMVGSLGGNSEKMIADMKRVTLATVDDTDLQAMAYKGLMAKINFKDQLVAMEYATKYALSTGQNFQDVYDQITQSFMRNTGRGLKTLGINVGDSKNVVKTAVEIMQSKMKDFSIDMNDPILKQQQLNTKIGDMKTQLGKDFVPAYGKLLELLDLMAKLSGSAINIIEKSGEAMGAAFNTNVKAGKVSLKELSNDQLKQLNEIAQERLKEGKYNADQVREVMAIIALREKELEIRKLINKKTPGALDETTGLPSSRVIPKTDETSNFKPPPDPAAVQAAIDAKKKLREQLLGIDREYDQVGLDEQGKALTEAFNDYQQKSSELGTATKDAQEGQLQLLVIYHGKVKEINDKASEEKQKTDDERAKEDLDKKRKELDALNKLYDEENDLAKDVDRKKKEETLEGQLQLLQEEYDKKKEILKNNQVALLELTRQFENERAKLVTQKVAEVADHWISTASNLTSGLETLNDAMTAKQIKALDKMNLSDKEYAKRKAEIEEESLEKRRMFARAEQLIIIAQTISNVAKGVASSLTGPPFIKWLDVAATIAAGAIQIATIEAQNFANGRGLVDMLSNGRNADTVNARLGKGEYVMPADKTAENINELEAMRKGVGTRATGQQIVQNFYSVPLESMIQVQRDIQRKNLATQRI
jgi:hypothetical protein